MPSVVDICNIALSHLGDSATVATIDPPEGSAQAEHCARFYPIARDTLFESHSWGFATRRSALALLTSPGTSWDYAYAQPAGMVNLLSVIPADATDDYSVAPLATWTMQPIVTGGSYVPQPFAVETLDDGTGIILTDQADAWARYTVVVDDTTKFSPLFVDCLGWLLASYLAGPVLKGETGAAAARTCFATYEKRMGAAIESDSNQRVAKPVHNVTWMAGR
jgi:hypothetical protein